MVKVCRSIGNSQVEQNMRPDRYKHTGREIIAWLKAGVDRSGAGHGNGGRHSRAALVLGPSRDRPSTGTALTRDCPKKTKDLMLDKLSVNICPRKSVFVIWDAFLMHNHSLRSLK